MESQVLEENNLGVVGLVDHGLDLRADTVGGHLDALAQKLLELRDDGLQAVLLVDLTVGTAEVGHQDNSLGAVVDGIFDGGDGTGDTLVVGDLLVGIEGDVEVDLKREALSVHIARTRGIVFSV